jgi:hypothetical protein
VILKLTSGVHPSSNASCVCYFLTTYGSFSFEEMLWLTNPLVSITH